MKAIAFQHPFGSAPATLPEINIIPDSALVVNNNPLFVPDFDTRWEGRIYPAFRICRLGKCISSRFAPRYYDAVTLSLRAVPAVVAAQLNGLPDGLLGAFDNCLVPGRWIPIPADGSLKIESPSLHNDISVADLTAIADAAIADISRYLTLKMGDIIMPGYFDTSLPLVPGSTVSASLNGDCVLSVRLR